MQNRETLSPRLSARTADLRRWLRSRGLGNVPCAQAWTLLAAEPTLSVAGGPLGLLLQGRVDTAAVALSPQSAESQRP